MWLATNRGDVFVARMDTVFHPAAQAPTHGQPGEAPPAAAAEQRRSMLVTNAIGRWSLAPAASGVPWGVSSHVTVAVDAAAGLVGVSVCNSRAGFGTAAAFLAAGAGAGGSAGGGSETDRGGGGSGVPTLVPPTAPPHPFTLAEPVRPGVDRDAASRRGSQQSQIAALDGSGSGGSGHAAPGTSLVHACPAGQGRAPFIHAAVSAVSWPEVAISRLQLAVLVRPSAMDGFVMTLLPPSNEIS
jgi:hypothetical protein